ncbi:HSF-type DNA-binding protein [Nitzschia inconspicua]|uniref:HSF-type DNA-binding protein n=1 Tax=Nitzschia inconspicua TaxID=303405 RepID=A0A9K3KXZ2_9STRA|nr:HSF-type DNA-binding protein [Nitzschia inconspicua]
MLEAVEESGDDNIVSWLLGSKSFKVHDVDLFTAAILPHFFQQTKYKSFQRQLNMWGFVRILTGPSAGGYNHDLFVRGREGLCKNMKRIKIKGSPEKRLKPIRCSNTRILSPRMPNFALNKSKEQSMPFRSQTSDENPSTNSSRVFLATCMGSVTKNLFDDIDQSESSSLSSFDDFELDLMFIEPLPLDSWQDGACDILEGLSTLVD